MVREIERRRRALREEIVASQNHYRILFIGRSVNGSTDIVSCLRRALQNLGHKVFNFDTLPHRDSISNPNRLGGGHGPVYVEYDKIGAIVGRLRPQIVVLCAGGLTFRDEHLEKLKAAGAVVVGITLSDPDVFPSVATYAAGFDFHTTNASAALEMYERAGVRNTLYFPFGIDRGFVTQVVPPAPDLRADVICLGHARPDRNRVMSALAQRFDVRTYGRRWELPKSEVVEGLRHVQASREGKIHVNFPATLAGFTNVKCGVFESVGSGAVLCTHRFPEMDQFFDYGTEIIGYSNEDDLSEQVEFLLKNSDAREQMAARAFGRLVSEHLYEHRWKKLFEQIEQFASSPPEWLPGDRAGKIQEILSETAPRTKQVIVSGIYGGSNLGDELILRSLSSSLEVSDPSMQVVVAAENPASVEVDHGLPAFPRRDHWEAANRVRTASAVILGGGGLWHDHTFRAAGGLASLFTGAGASIAGTGILPLLGSLREVPFYVTGLGVGPLDDEDARRLLRFVAAHAAEIVVRDGQSKAILDDVLGVPNKASQSPDLVYGLDLHERTPVEVASLRQGGRRIVAVNVRHWQREGGERIAATVAGALDLLAASEPVALVGVPMQIGPTHDHQAIAAVFDAMKVECPRLLLPPRATPGQVIWTLAEADAVLAMRLHACLLAHRLGRPVTGIGYDVKVSSHFAEVGRSDFCFPLSASSEEFSAGLRACLAVASLPTPNRERVSALEAESRDYLRRLGSTITSLPTLVATFEVPEKPQASPAPPPLAKRSPASEWTAVRPVDARTNTSIGSDGQPLPVTLREKNGEILLQIESSEPRAKDWAELSIELPVKQSDSFVLAFEIAAKARGNGYAPGKVLHELQVGGISFRQDPDQWFEPTEVRIYSEAAARLQLRLTIRFLATPPASKIWPVRSRAFLRNFRIQKSSYKGPMQARSDSPFMEISARPEHSS